MLNWIVWNWTVFDIETVLILNWIVIYNYLNYIKMNLVLNNLQRLICYKTQHTKPRDSDSLRNLRVMISRYYLNSQHEAPCVSPVNDGYSNFICTIHLRDTNGKNGLKKTTKTCWASWNNFKERLIFWPPDSRNMKTVKLWRICSRIV